MTAVRSDFDFLRGDTWLLDGVLEFDADEYPLGLGTDGIVVRCTIKRRLESADPAGGDLTAASQGNAQVDSDAIGGIEILSSTEYQVAFAPALTELFPVGDLHYDIAIDFSDELTFTVHEGTIHNRGDVTLTRL